MEIRIKINKKLLKVYGEKVVEKFLTEEINEKFIEYLDKEFERQCRGESKEAPKGLLGSGFIKKVNK